jgi:hypothetical protein
MIGSSIERCAMAALFVATASIGIAAQAEQYYLSDGVRIRFVEQGAGEPVLLIHRLLGSIDDWHARRGRPRLISRGSARQYSRSSAAMIPRFAVSTT